MMWMDFECETSLVAEMPETRQHFFVFSVNPGVYAINERMASFFLFFLRANRKFPVSNAFSLTKTDPGGTLRKRCFSFW
jgi:hypothetical protein